ncbi:Peroxidase 47 [Asimina triloba]
MGFEFECGTSVVPSGAADLAVSSALNKAWIEFHAYLQLLESDPTPDKIGARDNRAQHKMDASCNSPLTSTPIKTSRVSVHALSMDYYAMRCPFAEMRVRNAVNRALREDPTLSGPLLRMHFHDCFVEGCDASILIDSTKGNTAEKDSPANLSLRGYEIIDQIKQELEDDCPGVVSCADILAMAARDAVLWTGGPLYDIPQGRKDGTRSKIEDTINLPAPTLNSSDLIKTFRRHGFSVQELVALSGAHTLGVARCSSFKNRLSNFDPAHDVDPTLNANFAKTLAKTCKAGDKAEAPFDQTRTTFDNDYYNALQSGAGVLTSDQTLYASLRTRSLVNDYALNQAMFFLDFSQAMVRMGLVDVKEDDEGEIRIDCRKVN